MKQRMSKEAIFSGAMAGMLWGSWAYYVNSDYGFALAARAALSQGAGSAVMGTLLTLIMEFVYARRLWPRRLRMVASIFLPMLVTTVLLLAIHLLNATPEILHTMLPGQVVGYGWTTAYTLRLYSAKRLASDEGMA